LFKYRTSLDCPYRQLLNELAKVISNGGEYIITGFLPGGNDWCEVHINSKGIYELSRTTDGRMRSFFSGNEFTYEFDVTQSNDQAVVFGSIKLQKKTLAVLVGLLISSLIAGLSGAEPPFVIALLFATVLSVVYIIAALHLYKKQVNMTLNHIGNNYQG
jgi:hypothetical protein